MDLNRTWHEQKISYARASLWAPFYAVGMAARIQGNVPAALMEAALRKLRIQHPLLASRVRAESDGSAWFTTEGVGEFALEVRPKVSDDDWFKLLLEQERTPFPFDRGPVARFYLLQSPQDADLVVIAPHVICDGYSMAHVMCDAVALLNDPSRAVTPPAPAPEVTWQTMPHAMHDNLILRGLVRIANFAWGGARVAIQQEAYQDLHRQYWARQENGLLHFALSTTATSDLVARCRQHGVSVTGALVAAFLLARDDIWPSGGAGSRNISVAANIRDRMSPSPGNALGVYASAIDVRLRFRPRTPFWALANEGHTRIHQRLGDRARLLMPLVLAELDPLIIDALVAAVATDRWGSEFDLLTHFVRVKGDARCLNVSNIGRLGLPDVGKPYRLETLLPFPPLFPGSEMALNVLTARGEMHMIVKFRQHRWDRAVAKELRDRALGYLLEA